jgi:hypothetical protein
MKGWILGGIVGTGAVLAACSGGSSRSVGSAGQHEDAEAAAYPSGSVPTGYTRGDTLGTYSSIAECQLVGGAEKLTAVEYQVGPPGFFFDSYGVFRVGKPVTCYGLTFTPPPPASHPWCLWLLDGTLRSDAAARIEATFSDVSCESKGSRAFPRLLCTANPMEDLGSFAFVRSVNELPGAGCDYNLPD